MNRIRKLKIALRTSTVALCLAAPAAMIVAQPAIASETVAPVVEDNRYTLRMMLQTFDGVREFSHTQTAAFARTRRGDESWVMMDFGDGAVTIDEPNRKRIGSFRNDSPAEVGLLYNYTTKTLAGDSAVARHHNKYVRPMLGTGPALGADAQWRTSLTLDQLGMFTRAEQHVTLELSRHYFSHGGREMVLVHYRVPAFTWLDDTGRTIAQWGEGVALSDPGFGQVYWNAALHRAVAQPLEEQGHPYRLAKTVVALDDKGKPMIDPRTIPEAAAYVSRFYGASNNEVMEFAAETEGEANQAPLQLANLIDIMALSMAEDSANQLGEVSGAYTNGQRGNETGSSLASTLSQGNETFGYYDKGKVVLDATLQQLDPQLQQLTINLANWKAEGAALANKLANAEQALTTAQKVLETQSKYELVLSSKGQSLLDAVVNAEKTPSSPMKWSRPHRRKGPLSPM